MRNEINIAPIITAVELTLSPNAAIKITKNKIPKLVTSKKNRFEYRKTTFFVFSEIKFLKER
jgi:hypothetical protein